MGQALCIGAQRLLGISGWAREETVLLHVLDNNTEKRGSIARSYAFLCDTECVKKVVYI